MQKIERVLYKYQNGKLVVKMDIGLYDVCFYLQFTGYDRHFDDYTPPFHTCKKVTNISDNFGPETRHHLEEDHRMERIDKLSDGEKTSLFSFLNCL